MNEVWIWELKFLPLQARKDPCAALTARGVINSREELI